MTIICSFSCRFQIYRHFSFIFSSLGDNYRLFIMGYLDILNFVILAPKVKVAYNL